MTSEMDDYYQKNDDEKRQQSLENWNAGEKENVSEKMVWTLFPILSYQNENSIHS